MARTNGPRRPLAGSGSGEADTWRVTAGAAVTDGPSQTDPRFRPLNSDLDREAASPSVALWQRGFVSPKLPPAAAAQSRNKKPGAVFRPGMVAYYWIVRSLYEIRVTRVKGRRRSTLQRS